MVSLTTQTLADGTVATECRYESPEAVIAAASPHVCLPEYLHTAVLSRRADFLAGRYCAHQSLRTLGVLDPSVGVGSRREPLWPPGFVGSIAHTSGFAIAMVGSSRSLSGLGVDCEHVSPVVDPRLRRRIFADREWKVLLGAKVQATAEETFALGFAAKESVYKALFPLIRVYIAFHDVIVAPGPKDGVLEATFLRPFSQSIPLSHPCLVHWRRVGSLVITHAILHAPPDRE